MASIKNILKEYFLIVAAILTTIFGAALLYFKNKAQVDDVLLKEAKVNADISKDDSVIAANNQLLASEEQKRKETDNAKNNTIDLATYVNTKLKQ